MCRTRQNAHRFTVHERGLRESEALTINKESNPLRTVMLYFTCYPAGGIEVSVGEKSQTGDFQNMQEAAGTYTDSMGMRVPEEK
jgi:hypothetical protein